MLDMNHYFYMPAFAAILVFYSNGEEKKYGYASPTYVHINEFHLEEDERIIKINVTSDIVINSLTFYTNKDTMYGPYGGSGGVAHPSEGSVYGPHPPESRVCVSHSTQGSVYGTHPPEGSGYGHHVPESSVCGLYEGLGDAHPMVLSSLQPQGYLGHLVGVSGKIVTHGAAWNSFFKCFKFHWAYFDFFSPPKSPINKNNLSS